jgi:uncharacterized protein
VGFPEACQVFSDPFFHLVDATAGKKHGKPQSATWRIRCLLFVVHMVREEETIRIISVRAATAEERQSYEHE